MADVPIGIVRFPGTNCDQDVFDAVAAVEGACPVWLWHKETDLQGVKGVVLAGGFS
jgi:phosphoribosylformylglycinamidine synthase